MTGVAVNVTVDPWQKGFAEAATETLTGRFGLTVKLLLVAGLFEVQIVFEEVRIQFTMSPFKGV